MKPLSLRSRLVAGLAVVGLVLATAAWVVTTTTQTHLVDQIDERLERFGRVEPGRFPGREPGRVIADGSEGEGPPPFERFSDVYEALVLPDGSAQVLFASNVPGDRAEPDLTNLELADRVGDHFTVSAMSGGGRFRVLVQDVDAGLIVRAVPLDSVDATIDRLILMQLVASGAVFAVLIAVAWWMIRLGINPIRRMATRAQGIADGDLSMRVSDDDERSGAEVQALSASLDSMLGQIESAVNERQQSEDRLRRFVADASHELRTPISTIRGYAELYRHGGLESEEALADAMRRTEQESARIGRLVEEMLLLAELDEHRASRNEAVELTRRDPADAGAAASGSPSRTAWPLRTADRFMSTAQSMWARPSRCGFRSLSDHITDGLSANPQAAQGLLSRAPC